MSVADGRLTQVTTTSLRKQRLGSADVIPSSEIEHIPNAGAQKKRKIASVGKSAHTGRTQYALTTDARQDKPRICS